MPIAQRKKQTLVQTSFSFGEAAKMYAENIDLVSVLRESNQEDAKRLNAKYENVIGEMRMETLRSISQFGESLVQHLISMDLGFKKTTPQGQYAGGKLNYFWKNPNKKWDSAAKIMIPVLDPTKLRPENDAIWKTVWGCFEPILNNRVKVWVADGDCDSKAKDVVKGIVHDPSVGIYVEEDYWAHILMLPVAAGDPLNSAVDSLHRLIQQLP